MKPVENGDGCSIEQILRKQFFTCSRAIMKDAVPKSIALVTLLMCPTWLSHLFADDGGLLTLGGGMLTEADIFGAPGSFSTKKIPPMFAAARSTRAARSSTVRPPDRASRPIPAIRAARSSNVSASRRAPRPTPALAGTRSSSTSARSAASSRLRSASSPSPRRTTATPRSRRSSARSTAPGSSASSPSSTRTRGRAPRPSRSSRCPRRSST